MSSLRQIYVKFATPKIHRDATKIRHIFDIFNVFDKDLTHIRHISDEDSPNNQTLFDKDSAKVRCILNNKSHHDIPYKNVWHSWDFKPLVQNLLNQADTKLHLRDDKSMGILRFHVLLCWVRFSDTYFPRGLAKNKWTSLVVRMSTTLEFWMHT